MVTIINTELLLQFESDSPEYPRNQNKITSSPRLQQNNFHQSRVYAGGEVAGIRIPLSSSAIGGSGDERRGGRGALE